MEKSRIYTIILGIIIAVCALFMAFCIYAIVDFTGREGPTGETGKAGSTLHTGTDAPSMELEYNIGDLYLDTDNYILYQKTASEWQVIMNDFGKPGTDGESANDGNIWIVGDDTPNNEIGVVGDMYLNKITYQVFQKTTNGWEYQCSIQSDPLDTHYITTAEEWVEFTSNIENYAGTLVKLKNDIDMSNIAYTAVSINATNWTNKTIYIDGGGFAIKNLNCVDSNVDYTGFVSSGLFANAIGLEKLNIKNLTLDNATISQTNGSSMQTAAGLFGYIKITTNMKLTLNNCKILNSNITGSHYSAGLIGYIEGSGLTLIQDCIISGNTFNGNDATGGMIALNNGTYEIKSSSNNRCKVINNTINGGTGYSAGACVGTSKSGIIGSEELNVLISGNDYLLNNVYGATNSAIGKTYLMSGTISFNGTVVNSTN